LDDSFSNNDDIGKKAIMPKNLNIKHGIARYKLKLEEKKKLEKQFKFNGRQDFEKSKTLNSPNFWQSDTDNPGNALFDKIFIITIFYESKYSIKKFI